jgi:hypothetical protein
MEEINFIKEAAPYLIPFFGVLFLIVFVKRYLFQDMVGVEHVKEQFEREKVILVQYQNVISQLDDMIKQLSEITKALEAVEHKIADLAYAVDTNIVNQILRLTPEERDVIKNIRSREPLTEIKRQILGD